LETLKLLKVSFGFITEKKERRF